MVKVHPCWSVIVLTLLAVPCHAGHRRLLHAGEHHEETPAAGSVENYLDQLQSQGITPEQRLNQVLGVEGLNEEGINTLLQDVQGETVPSTTANTSLSADNIVDTYAGTDGTLNGTSASVAALAILACKADSSCQLSATAANNEDAEESGPANSDNIEWLKWIGAAVLFVEGLIGLLVPFCFKLRLPFFGGWFLSALNCFAGGVFLTFGFMHLLPDAVSAVPDHVADQFPMGYFFPVLGFLLLFLLTRVVAPIASKGCHTGVGGCCAPPVLPQTTANPAYTVDRSNSIHKPLATASENGSSDAEPGCTNCGCDRDVSPETASLAPGTAAAATAAAPGIKHMTWQAWLSPIFVWAGICVHAILEGLALGLQRDKAGTVTVLVAMVSHKWVESVALSSILVKKGGGFKEVLICLLPFAACFFLGTGIGVGVGRDEDPWIDVVLYGLIAGAFIFVGGCELVATEFSSEANRGKNRFRRGLLFLAVFAGFVLVALLQLVHG
ncbi:hypothetical protein ABBQ38_009683 [Trebouxia sp. C0009 RCD-2024]